MSVTLEIIETLNKIEVNETSNSLSITNVIPSVNLQQTKNTVTENITENTIELVDEVDTQVVVNVTDITIEDTKVEYKIELTAAQQQLDIISTVNKTNLDVVTNIIEIRGGGGSDGFGYTDINDIFTFAGLDVANTVVNGRFFVDTLGWVFSGAAERLNRTNIEVPSNAPYEYVARFGGQYAHYIGRSQPVVLGEHLYAEVSVATPVAAPNISLKVFYYDAAGAKVDEDTIDFTAASLTWVRLRGHTVVSEATAVRAEFVLEITGASSSTYNPAHRWYFTGGKLLSTADTELSSARIDTEITVRAAADSALASSITTLSTTVGGMTTSISTLTSSVNGIQAQWGVSINTNGVVTGAIKLDSISSFSTFAVQVDKFLVTNSANTEGGAPFEIIGGTTFIKQAVIPDLTTRNLVVKDSGNIKVIDSQVVPVTRVEIGSIGADYGLIVRNAAGAIIFNVDSLGTNVVGTTNIVGGAVTPAKTNLPAINNTTGDLNSNTVDVTNIINGAVTAAKTSLAAINNSTGNLNNNTVDVTNIINGAVTAAKTNLAAINSGTGNLNNNTVDTAQIIANAVTAAKTNLAAINNSTGNLNANTVDTTQIIANAVTAAKTSLAAINSTTGNLNSNTVDTAQIINGAISDAAKFSTSIRPVEVVGALPVSGNFTGRTVFLTSDQKLYRYNGSAYTASVPTTDLSGTIINGQIAANAVDAAAIAAGAVTAVKTALAAINSSTGNLNANTVTATNIVAGTITTTQIAANTIVAGNIAAGTITTTQIAANTIVAGNIAANTITAGQIAANTITAGQIAAGTITATQIAANAITASKLLITNSYNMIGDADLWDASYWTNVSGWTINTSDSTVVTSMNLRSAWKSVVGNGTTSQSSEAIYSSLMTVESGKSFRFASRFAVITGFTGRLTLVAYWYKRDGTTSASTPSNGFTGTDYRSVAAGAEILQTALVNAVAPSDAYYVRWAAVIEWSTTLNNAGRCYVGLPQTNRMNDGELVVDGAITAAKIAANTITAGQIAAGTITATQIASGTITAGLIAAGSITASKLLITSGQNLIDDSDLRDISYWSVGSGWTINTADSAVVTDLAVRAAWKSVGGNGTTSQALTTVDVLGLAPVEFNKPHRASARVRIPTGFTGQAYIQCLYYGRDGTTFLGENFTAATDYRTVAAASAVTIQLDFQAPTNVAGTAYIRFRMAVNWSTTLNNAGNAYFSNLQLNRAISGELIVDGNITAAKIAANTITASQIAAGTITGDRIAANTITASKILLTDAVNMIRDSEYFEGAAMWGMPAGPVTFVTSDTLVTALNAIRVAKITGVGTSAPLIIHNYIEQYSITVEPSKPFHASVDYALTSGFNGYMYSDVVTLNKDGTILSYYGVGSVADYLASPAGSTITGNMSGIITTDATAVRAIFRTIVYWGPDYATRNKGGTAGFTRPYMRRAANAELIVDGTITAAKIAAATITATQIATGTITATQIAANTITASRLVLSDVSNMLLDSEFTDSTYWVMAGGMTINSADASDLAAIPANRAMKSATGNGTTSQAASTAYNNILQWANVEPSKPLRFSAIARIKAGFTGRVYLAVDCFDRVKSYVGTSLTLVLGDYRTVAAVADTVLTSTSMQTVSATTAYVRFGIVVDWSSTLNNAQFAYVGTPKLMRAVNADLIVDGSITAVKIQANTITASQIAAGTITATEIATNSITASKIIISNGNLIMDPDLRDPGYWVGVGYSIDTTDTVITSNMGIRAAFKSLVGNGTTSQSFSALGVLQVGSPAVQLYPLIEANQWYRVHIRTAVTAGHTGAMSLQIQWYNEAAALQATSSTVIFDYRTVAAASLTVQNYSVLFQAPASGSSRARLRVQTDWSTTLNNAGYNYVGTPTVSRAISAELIVDGTIVAAKIAANTITAGQIAAGTITATQIAAGAITASKIFVGDSSNMVLDSDVVDLSYWRVAVGSSAFLSRQDCPDNASVLAIGSKGRLVISGTTTTLYVETQLIKVNPNEVYYVKGTIYNSGSVTQTSMWITEYDWTGTTVANYLSLLVDATTTGYRSVETRVTVGSTTRYIALMYCKRAGADTPTIWMGGPIVRRATTGVLIADGAITAAKIAAGTITSNEIATDSIKSSTWNNATKTGWLLGTNGDIQASDISIWSPGVSPKKIFGASGMSYNGSNFYGLDQIITKINKASEDGSPDTQIFDGTNPDTWVDMCDIVITATGGQDIDIDINTDMLVEQLFDTNTNIKYAAGPPEFRYRLRRTQGSTVDLKTSEWFKISSVGQLPSAIFPVRDTTAVAGSATYLMQAQWRKGTYTAGTVSKSASSLTINGTGVSWIANIGQSGSISESGNVGVRAFGSISFTVNPANGNTVTVNGVVFTFVTGTPVGNQVQIGANANATATNLANTLNASVNASVSVATYYYVAGTGVYIYYDTVGTAGNSFTLAKVGANISITGATLTGGAATPAGIPWEIRVSSVDPNWWAINTIVNRTQLSFNTDTGGAYNALFEASLSGASYEIRAAAHSVIMRLKNYTIRTTEYRNTAVT